MGVQIIGTILIESWVYKLIKNELRALSIKY